MFAVLAIRCVDFLTPDRKVDKQANGLNCVPSEYTSAQ